MSGSADSSQILIVGAGPAGAALAHVLATRGFEVALLERQSDFSREFRGEVLAPSGIAVLDSLGLKDGLSQVPVATPTELNLFVSGRSVLRNEFAEETPDTPLPRVFSQPALLEAIVQDAQARSTLRFERGASVKELLHENGRVIGVRARTPEGERRMFAELVIGCDGRASAVRRFAPIEVKTEKLPMDIVWCKLPRPSEFGERRPLFVCIGKGHLFISYVAADGLLQVAWVILKGTFGELKRQPLEQWVDQLADFGPPELSDHLRKNAQQFSHPFLLDTCADRAVRWSVPGALVLGDAAHTMSPVGGQGLNIALRDALVAANHLVPVLKAGGAPEELDAASARIEAERLPEVAFIQRMQAQPPKVVMGKAWWADLLRHLPKLLRFERARAQALQVARPLLFGTTDVSLRV